jgi:tetratricopeptide (TPR) repeat protein
MSKTPPRPENRTEQNSDRPAQKILRHHNKGLSEQSSSQTRLLTLLSVLVCAAVLFTHWPALSARALSFDDDQYLTENPLVQNPSCSSAWQFLTEVLEPSTVQGYYQPLAMISLMTDYAFGGRADNLKPFHRTSLALHTANTALIIVLLYLLFGQAWIAAAIGLLFGVHPMTVEPIPWVGERKTLLAAFFALWCLILYVRYTRRNSWQLYVGCFAMYVLALASKPTTIPLPVLMLLMDLWPLKRLNKTAVLEKIPLLVIGGVSAIVTYISQSRTAFTALPGQYGPAYVPLVLCHNIVFYLYKIIWPAKLSSHYAFPVPLGLSHPMVLAGVIGTCILIPLLAISLRWTRGLLTGWLFFFVAIFPTMGVVGFTNVIASDKFVYLPSIGLLMILAAFLGWFCSAGKPLGRQVFVVIIVVTLAAAESVAARQYLVRWRDTEGLFEHMLALTPNEALVHNNLGTTLKFEGKLDKALSHFRKALQLRPDYAEAHNNLGAVLEAQGKLDEAASHYRKAMELKPNLVNALYNLGKTLQSQGKLDEAVSCYRQALQAKPNDAPTHCILGYALQSQGKLDEAIGHYHQALQIKPDFAEAHLNLANTLKSQNKLDEAVSHYRQALQLEPDSPEAHNNLGSALRLQEKFDEAISHFRQAVQIKPDFVEAHFNLANALSSVGKFDDALGHYRQVLQLKPNFAKAHSNFGIVLELQGNLNEALDHFRQALRIQPDYPSPLNEMAKILAAHPDPKIRNPSQAVNLAERAAQLTKYQDPAILDTLAAAYAASGRFDRAAKTAQTALDLASATGDKPLADQLGRKLEIYRQTKR